MDQLAAEIDRRRRRACPTFAKRPGARAGSGMAHQLVACNAGLPLVEAKRKTDDAWRGTGNGENEEEVEMMYSAEASLEVK